MSVIYEYLKKLKISSSTPDEFKPKISLFNKASHKKEPFYRKLKIVNVRSLVLVVIVFLLGIGVFLGFSYLKKSLFVNFTPHRIHSYGLPENRVQKNEMFELSSEVKNPRKSFVEELKRRIEREKDATRQTRKFKPKKELKKEQKSALIVKKTGSPDTKNVKKLFSHKTKGFEDKFFARIKKNDQVFKINQKLKTLFLGQNLKECNSLLKELEKVAGKESVIVLKWKGILAFESKDFLKAKKIFSLILQKNPDLKDVRINLILTLLSLNQKELARKEFVRLRREFPADKQVTRLKMFF